MKQRTDATRFGIVVYAGVEPIDIGGTVGVISMARRILPGIDSVTIAAEPGLVHLAGGLSIVAAAGFNDHPSCDVYVVCGGPGWETQVTDQAMLTFLRRLPAKPLHRFAREVSSWPLLACSMDPRHHTAQGSGQRLAHRLRGSRHSRHHVSRSKRPSSKTAGSSPAAAYRSPSMALFI